MKEQDRYISFLKEFEGKRVFLITKSLGNHYQTNNLKVVGNSVLFNDKFGASVMVSVDDIGSIVEVRRLKNG